MIDLKLESQGIWIANLADEYAFKIEPVGSPEISMNQRFKLASRIARCVSAMAGIGDDNALFAPGNSVRSVISTMELKRLELDDKLTTARAEAEAWEKRACKEAASANDLQAKCDELLAKLEALVSASRPIGNVAYNLGQRDEQWNETIWPATKVHDEAMIAAIGAIARIKFDTQLHGKTIAELQGDGHLPKEGGAA